MKQRPDLKRWLHNLVETVPVQMASIMLYIPNQEQLEIFASIGFQEAPDLVLPRGAGIAGKVMEAGKPAIVNNVADDPNFVESEYDTRQLLVVPIFHEGEAVGTVNLSNPQDKLSFEEDDREAVEQFIGDNPFYYEFYVST